MMFANFFVGPYHKNKWNIYGFVCFIRLPIYKFIKRYEIAVLIKMMVKKYYLALANEMYFNYLN